MFPLIFEETTSPLTRSNDGRLQFDLTIESKPRVFIVRDTHENDAILLETYERVIVDAYIAGYDLAADATKSSDVPPGGDSA